MTGVSPSKGIIKLWFNYVTFSGSWDLHGKHNKIYLFFQLSATVRLSLRQTRIPPTTKLDQQPTTSATTPYKAPTTTPPSLITLQMAIYPLRRRTQASTIPTMAHLLQTRAPSTKTPQLPSTTPPQRLPP